MAFEKPLLTSAHRDLQGCLNIINMLIKLLQISVYEYQFFSGIGKYLIYISEKLPHLPSMFIKMGKFSK